ncbi:MAG: hypothetical protein H0U70_01825 [Tatlockia sp.]|nr:hypothetical protein [Tatlockia sp.]
MKKTKKELLLAIDNTAEQIRLNKISFFHHSNYLAEFMKVNRRLILGASIPIAFLLWKVRKPKVLLTKAKFITPYLKRFGLSLLKNHALFLPF